MVDQEYPLNSLIFTMHDNEFRSSRVKRIVIDETGTNYICCVDGVNIERTKKEIAKTKEDLFNKLVTRHQARQNK